MKKFDDSISCKSESSDVLRVRQHYDFSLLDKMSLGLRHSAIVTCAFLGSDVEDFCPVVDCPTSRWQRHKVIPRLHLQQMLQLAVLKEELPLGLQVDIISE